MGSETIGFAATDLLGGLGYYRGRVPCRMVQEAGRDACVGGDIDYPIGGGALRIFEADDHPGVGAFANGKAFCPHVIVLAGGFPHTVRAGGIRAAQRDGQCVIVDVDDSPWLPSWHPHYTPALERERIEAITAADIVTVGTPKLANEIARFCARAPVVVPNAIDVSEGAGRLARASLAREEFVIGYRGPIEFHRGDLDQLDDAASRLLNAVPWARFVHLGATDPAEFAKLLRIPEERCEARPMRAFDQYLDALDGIDLAILPWSQTRYCQAKGAGGALEWSIAGVPWISSRQPEYLALAKTPMGSLRWAFPTRRDEWRGLLEQFGQRPAQRAAQWSAQIEAIAPRLFGLDRKLREQMEVPAERISGAWLTAIDRALGCR